MPYRRIRQLIGTGCLTVIAVYLTGCVFYSRIDNRPLIDEDAGDYRGVTFARQHDFGEVLLILSFSGGGTRAAALSYGVLKELRDTPIVVGGQKKRLLDEVDVISSVSGGSFTAAYYGVFGEQIFVDYEEVFLKRNIQKMLINGLLNPANWYLFLTTGFDRSSMAIEYYDNYIFQEATFADMAVEKGPFIQINATDLGNGQPFKFTQTMFDFLCSDLSEFKVSRAVAASSAVPVAFAPIPIKNYPGCETGLRQQLLILEQRVEDDLRTDALLRDLATYLQKEEREYIHLVDGGISDNLGMRSIYDYIELMGGIRGLAGFLGDRLPSHFVILLVNAQTDPKKDLEQSDEEPAVAEVIGAVTDAQIHRYNIETLSLAQEKNNLWSRELAESGNEKVTFHFIQIAFEGVRDYRKRNFYNNIATSLALPDDQVNELVRAGHELLRKSPEFNQLLKALK